MSRTRSVGEDEPRRELRLELRVCLGETAGAMAFDHAEALVEAWRLSSPSAHDDMAVYQILGEALLDARAATWGSAQRRDDVLDASRKLLVAMRTFERAYLEYRWMQGVDGLDRVIPGWRSGVRLHDPLLRRAGALRHAVDREQARVRAQASRSAGRPETQDRIATIKAALSALGMRDRTAEEIIRAVGLRRERKRHQRRH